MTRVHLSEVLAETALVAYSAGFLILYITIKVVHLNLNLNLPSMTWRGY